MVEEDGDEVLTPISAGCVTCGEWIGNKRVAIKLEKVERFGKLWWQCPRCHGSYGEAK